MARIRSIKPGFFSSEDVSALPMSARLTWIGLWTHCDDHGRTKDNIRLVKAQVWPLDPDVSLHDVEADLHALADAGRIVRYLGDDGKPYLAVVNWHCHQAISKPTAAKHPAPPRPVNPLGLCPACDQQSHGGGHPLAQDAGTASAEAGVTPGALPEGSGSAPGRKGRERSGREGTRASGRRPPRRCPTHANHPNPPACGACAQARREHDSWATPTASAPPCPIHPDERAGICPKCPQLPRAAPDFGDQVRAAQAAARSLAATG